jgi:hypothetical protein
MARKKAISGNESKVSGNNSSPKSGQGNKNKNNKKKK